jgi:hypothetical protein
LLNCVYIRVFGIFQNRSVLGIFEGNLCWSHVVAQTETRTHRYRQMNDSFSHFVPSRKIFIQKLSVSQMHNISPTSKSLQQFIAPLHYPSHTVTLSQYTAFLRQNILYFPFKKADILVKLISLIYAVQRELVNIIYFAIRPYYASFLSNYVTGTWIVTRFKVIFWTKIFLFI